MTNPRSVSAAGRQIAAERIAPPPHSPLKEIPGKRREPLGSEDDDPYLERVVEDRAHVALIGSAA